ncbi:MAG: PAS domain-containing protein [Polyangiaceae bacterium]|nr:PAS domain-containing protein [Polyangiaceae bacterium]
MADFVLDDIKLLPESEFATSLPLLEEATALGTYVWEPSKGLWWSRGMFRVIGLDPEARLTTAAFMERVHPDDRHLIVGAPGVASTDGAIDPIEWRLLRPNGEMRWILGRGYHAHDGEGRLLRAIGTAMDITELRIARRELTEAHALLKETQLVAGVGTHIFDITTRRLEISDGLRKVLGIGPDEPIDDHLIYRVTHPDDRAAQAAWGVRALAGELVPPLRVRGIRKDGSIVYMETIGRRVERDSGLALVGVTIDITERVRLEQELRQAAKMEAMGNLAAHVAHDFGNYLTILGVHVEAMERADGPPEPTALADMKQALAQSSALVRELLAFARPGSPERVPTDLGACASSVVRMFSTVARVEAHLAAEQGVVALVDRNQIDAALMNLLVNARDASPNGVRIRITVDVYQSGGTRWARIAVADRGQGILPEHIDRVFDPYFTTKPEGAGTGLGLASAYAIAKQHGGSIRVESTVGIGTRFEMLLPLAEG